MSITKILVADDEESIRWVLSKHFKRKGIIVDVAQDSDQALNMILENNYELAILDNRMPGINTLDLLDRIRETKRDLYQVIEKLVVLAMILIPTYAMIPRISC